MDSIRHKPLWSIAAPGTCRGTRIESPAIKGPLFTGRLYYAPSYGITQQGATPILYLAAGRGGSAGGRAAIKFRPGFGYCPWRPTRGVLSGIATNNLSGQGAPDSLFGAVTSNWRPTLDSLLKTFNRLSGNYPYPASLPLKATSYEVVLASLRVLPMES